MRIIWSRKSTLLWTRWNNLSKVEFIAILSMGNRSHRFTFKSKLIIMMMIIIIIIIIIIFIWRFFYNTAGILHPKQNLCPLNLLLIIILFTPSIHYSLGLHFLLLHSAPAPFFEFFYFPSSSNIKTISIIFLLWPQ